MNISGLDLSRQITRPSAPAAPPGVVNARPDGVASSVWGTGELTRAQLLANVAVADDGAAPGGPGATSTWTTGSKDGVGTAYGRDSKVWFTVAQGRLTEVRYPTVDKANVRETKFLVSDGKTFAVLDTDTPGEVVIPDNKALAFQYKAENKEHGFTMTKTYVTDPKRNTVAMNVSFKSNTGQPLDVYVIHEPANSNSGMGDTALTKGGALVSYDHDIAQALTCSTGFSEISNGFSGGGSDGAIQLLRDFTMKNHYSSATDGHVVQVAKVASQATEGNFELALGFGADTDEALSTSKATLGDGFPRVYQDFTQGWHGYIDGLKKIDTPYQEQLYAAAMSMEAHEDKTNPGAAVAGVTYPWGDAQSANSEQENKSPRYAMVWSRDLCKWADGKLAVGDEAGARRALDFLFDKQQHVDPGSDRFGSFPQNTYVDGKVHWDNLQLDQTAYPLILAQRLGVNDKESYQNHIKPAAEFIAKKGPFTDQERWEEMRGISPSTLAPAIAGLVCAADIATKNNDPEAAKYYLAKADDWKANIKNWCVTKTGSLGEGKPYFMRINNNFDPEDGSTVWIPNGGGAIDKRNSVDGGFLEFVRLGILPPDDPDIINSLKVIDKELKVDTPFGPGYHRNTRDGFGESADGKGYVDESSHGIGRLWPLLNGERGTHAVALQAKLASQVATTLASPASVAMVLGKVLEPHEAPTNSQLAQQARDFAQVQETAMAKFANAGRQIPEQVYDRPNPNRPGEMNLGLAAQSLDENYSLAQYVSAQGGLINRQGLEKLAAPDPHTPSGLTQAAGFLLSNSGAFDELDTGAGAKDGLIGQGDISHVLRAHPEDLVPTSLQFGRPTGSAAGLAWSQAEFAGLTASIAAGKVVSTPECVAQRYLA